MCIFVVQIEVQGGGLPVGPVHPQEEAQHHLLPGIRRFCPGNPPKIRRAHDDGNPSKIRRAGHDGNPSKVGRTAGGSGKSREPGDIAPQDRGGDGRAEAG